MSDWIRCPFPIISVKQVWNGVSCIQILADGPQIGSHSIETQMDEYRHGYLLIFGFKKNVIYISELQCNIIQKSLLLSISSNYLNIFSSKFWKLKLSTTRLDQIIKTFKWHLYQNLYIKSCLSKILHVDLKNVSLAV